MKITTDTPFSEYISVIQDCWFLGHLISINTKHKSYTQYAREGSGSFHTNDFARGHYDRAVICPEKHGFTPEDVEHLKGVEVVTLEGWRDVVSKMLKRKEERNG